MICENLSKEIKIFLICVLIFRTSCIFLIPKISLQEINFNSENLYLEQSLNINKIGFSSFKEYLIENDKHSKIIVAIIDSGVDQNNNSIRNRLYETKFNFLDFSTNVNDELGHGTIISEIIAQNTNDNVKIMALKVTNNYDSINFNHSLNISKAVKYAVDHNANIINLSLQIRSNQNELKESIEYAISKGVVVVVAAGNNKKDVTGYYPAADKNVITVSSVDDEYNVAKFSNYGDSIDVAAPGVNIINWSSFNGYSMHSGTSISTGFTSAACALLLSDNINLTPKDIENILKNSTKDFANYSLKGFYGDGVIDLNKYLYYVRCGLDTTKLFID